jgi:hypothetical protein
MVSLATAGTKQGRHDASGMVQGQGSLQPRKVEDAAADLSGGGQVGHVRACQYPHLALMDVLSMWGWSGERRGEMRGLGGARGATVRCGLPGRVCGSATHTCSIYRQQLPGQWRREGRHIRGRHVRNEGSSDLLGLLEAALLGQTRVIVAVQLVHRQHCRTAVSGTTAPTPFCAAQQDDILGEGVGGQHQGRVGRGHLRPVGHKRR